MSCTRNYDAVAPRVSTDEASHGLDTPRTPRGREPDAHLVARGAVEAEPEEVDRLRRRRRLLRRDAEPKPRLEQPEQSPVAVSFMIETE